MRSYFIAVGFTVSCIKPYCERTDYCRVVDNPWRDRSNQVRQVFQRTWAQKLSGGPLREARQAMAGTDELSAATEGLSMGNESASSSSTAGSAPPTTLAADTGLNDKGEPESPNSHVRIPESARGEESTPLCTCIPAWVRAGCNINDEYNVGL